MVRTAPALDSAVDNALTVVVLANATTVVAATAAQILWIATLTLARTAQVLENARMGRVVLRVPMKMIAVDLAHIVTQLESAAVAFVAPIA